MNVLRKLWPRSARAAAEAVLPPAAAVVPVPLPEPEATGPLSPAAFRVPQALRVTPTRLDRILVVGSCLVESLLAELGRGRRIAGDFILFNNVGALPAQPPQPVAAYDLQIVQIPLRSILPDLQYAGLRYHAPADFETVLREAEERIALFLDAAMRWNRETGIATFVVNFMAPQQDPLGRLMPRGDLRSFPAFLARLNQCLAERVATYTNAYVLDFDGIAATVGRIHLQDEHLWMLNHNATIGDFDHALDQERLHPPEPISLRTEIKIAPFFEAVHAEIEAMVRTLRGTDAVKLVIVDLDDTLWRGVMAEEGSLDAIAHEGWPYGVLEALAVLRTRGIVLAIASKNDEAAIRARWNERLAVRLPLDAFAVIRIDWRPKAETVAEILSAVNVLPGSAVFIDDNPLERAAVRAAFPEIRTLGEDLYAIRRTLLWSPETQVPVITDESGRRTEMIQAQSVREATRGTLSREAFLATLETRITPIAIDGAEHPRFARAFELINKTNQFNTTGRRWTPEAMRAGFADGLRLHAFEVADRFTDYGLVGVIVLRGSEILQLVMSCRVVGLDIEDRMLAHVIGGLDPAEHGRVTAAFVATERNGLCAEVYAKAGFHPEGEGEGEGWARALA